MASIEVTIISIEPGNLGAVARRSSRGMLLSGIASARDRRNHIRRQHPLANGAYRRLFGPDLDSSCQKGAATADEVDHFCPSAPLKCLAVSLGGFCGVDFGGVVF